MYIKNCNECGSSLIETLEGTLVCSNCGLIVDIYNKFESLPYKTETGISVKNVLGSEVGKESGFQRDYLMKVIPFKLQEKINSMKRLNKDLKMYETSHIVNSRLLLTTLQICSHLNLTKKKINEIFKLYNKALKFLENNNYKFTSTTVLAACILVTLRLSGDDKIITLEEITELYKKYRHRLTKNKLAWCVSLINKKIINKYISYKDILKTYLERCLNNIKDNLIKKENNYYNNKINIYYYLNMTKLEAFKIIENLDTLKLQAKDAYPLSAAILYLAIKLVRKKFNVKKIITQKEICELLRVPPATLRYNIQLLNEKVCLNV